MRLCAHGRALDTVDDISAFLISLTPACPFVRTRSRDANCEKHRMTDLLFIAIAIGFFGLSIAYTYGCDKLRGGNHD
jgi:hypothetical protein